MLPLCGNPGSAFRVARGLFLMLSERIHMSHKILLVLLAASISVSCDRGREKEAASREGEDAGRPPRRERTDGGGMGTADIPAEWKDLGTRIGTFSDAELQDVLDRTSAVRNSQQGRQAFTAAISELAKRDPKQALSWFKGKEMSAGEAGLTPVAFIVAKSDPQALKDWIKNDLKQADNEVRAVAVDTSMAALSRADAKAALDYAMGEKWGFYSTPEMINAVFSEYGRQSPEEAVAAASKLFKGSEKNLALHNIILSLAGTDVEKAMGLVKEMGDSGSRGRTIAGVMSQAMTSDPAAAVARLKTLDKGDLQSALQLSPEFPASLVRTLGAKDPAALKDLMAGMTPSQANQPVFKAAVEMLTQSDPAGAAELIGGLPEGPFRESMIQRSVQTLAKADAGKAMEVARGLGSGAVREKAYQTIGLAIGNRDGGEVMKMADSLQGGDRDAFLGSAMSVMASKDPRQVADLLADPTVIKDGAARQSVLTTVGNQLAASDPGYARSWIDKLPAADQPLAMKGYATELARTDVRELSVMLSSMPRDGKWAAATRVLIENIKGSDPESAATWQKELDGSGIK